jgi:hypothetical protein
MFTVPVVKGDDVFVAATLSLAGRDGICANSNKFIARTALGTNLVRTPFGFAMA